MTVAAAFALLMLLYGSVYTFPALTPDIAAELQCSRADLQGAFALYLLAVAAISPVAGAVIDRGGTRRPLLIGVAGLASAWTVLAVAGTAWHVYLAVVGLAAPAHALVQVGSMVAVSRARAAGRGRALGVAGTGIGLGLSLLVPAAVWIAGATDWRFAVATLAGLVGLVGTPAAALVRVSRPESRAPAPGRPDPRLARLLVSRPFAWLFGGGVGIGVLDEAAYQHLVPHLIADGMHPGGAGAVLGLVSAGYLGGQMAGGSGSDRWGRWPTGALAAALAGFGLLWLARQPASSPVGPEIAAVLYGIGLGATIVVRNAAVADAFDGPFLGAVTGVYQWAYALGGAAVSWLGALAQQRGGTYVPAFVGGAAGAALWALCLHAVMRRSRVSAQR